MTKYFDVHAHIASEKEVYKDIGQTLQRASKAGVMRVVDSGYDMKSSKQALALSKEYPQVIPTCGLQPEILIPGSDVYMPGLDIIKSIKDLRELYLNNSDRYKAIGECGLDYYWLDKVSKLQREEVEKIKKRQIKLFQLQIELALQHNMPLIIHSRGAEAECLSIINDLFYAKASKSKQKGVMKRSKVLFHSFTGDISIAKEMLERGHYISFNGILTYSGAGDIRKLFEFAWSNYPDLVLSETDSPFLAPNKSGSRICEPSFIKYTVEKMADIAGEKLVTLADKLIINAERYYSL